MIAVDVLFARHFASLHLRWIAPARICICAMLAALAAGCAARPSEIGREPVLSPVGSGIARPAHDPTAELKRGYAAAVAAQPISTGSLWRDRAADLFRDPRARHVGDILTVTISMKDKASLDNKSKRSRDATRGFGLDMSHDIDWSAFVSAGSAKVDTAIKSNTSTDGKGEIARSENIDLRVAAVVTEVLPNGSLLIQGSQEIRVNYELRVLTFTGVVSITDIKADNTIPHDRIAEVRMSYGGRGRSMEVQQPAWGQQIVDLVFPF